MNVDFVRLLLDKVRLRRNQIRSSLQLRTLMYRTTQTVKLVCSWTSAAFLANGSTGWAGIIFGGTTAVATAVDTVFNLAEAVQAQKEAWGKLDECVLGLQALLSRIAAGQATPQEYEQVVSAARGLLTAANMTVDEGLADSSVNGASPPHQLSEQHSEPRNEEDGV